MSGGSWTDVVRGAVAACRPEACEPAGVRLGGAVAMRYVSREGCRATDKGEADTVKVATDINVQNNVVYEFIFNNGQIASVIEKANDEVALKQALEAIKK